MRSWPYLLLSLLTAGVLAPLGLALCLRRVEAGRVALACLGVLGCAILLWREPYLRSTFLVLIILPGLLAFAVGEVRRAAAWGRGLLVVLGQILVAQGLGLLVVGVFFHSLSTASLSYLTSPAAFLLLGAVFLVLGVALVEGVVRRWRASGTEPPAPLLSHLPTPLAGALCGAGSSLGRGRGAAPRAVRTPRPGDLPGLG